MKRILLIGTAIAALALAQLTPVNAAESELSKATANTINTATTVADKAANSILAGSGEVWDVTKKYAATLAELSKEYAPKAVEAGLWVVRLEGIQKLVRGFTMLFVFLGAAWWVCTRVWRVSETFRAQDNKYLIRIVVGGGFGIAGLGLLAQMLNHTIFNIWVWVQVFEPQLWLARALILKVL